MKRDQESPQLPITHWQDCETRGFYLRYYIYTVLPATAGSAIGQNLAIAGLRKARSILGDIFHDKREAISLELAYY